MEDQENEFTRLHAASAWADMEALAEDRHGSQSSLDGSPRLKHLYAVSDLAEKLARDYFEDLDLATQVYWTKVCKAAGLLHEAIGSGCAFEDLVGVSDEAVARAVADGQPDLRLPAPRRLELHANSIGLSTEAAQIVKLCDLRHEAVIRVRVMESRPDPQTVSRVSEWVAEAQVVSGVLRKIESLVTAIHADRLHADLVLLEKLVSRFRSRKKKAKVRDG